MATKSSWAAALLVVAGSTFIAAGCRTAPERSSAASAEESGMTGTATATTEQPARSTEGGQAGAASPQRGSSETAQTGSTASAYEVTGRVEKIDEASIQVAGKQLKIDSSTSVSKGGIGATLADVKEGDEVRASLSGSGDPPKAERIEVMPATEAPPATKTPPPRESPPATDTPEATDPGTTR
jgi:hypothetical protein